MTYTHPMRMKWLGVVSLFICAPITFGASGATVKHKYAELPLAFEQNLGQAPADVDYVVRTSRYRMLVNKQGARLLLKQADGKSQTVAIRMDNASGAARNDGGEKLPGVVNYLIGSQSDWRTDIPTFSKVRFKSIYPGIDVVYLNYARSRGWRWGG